MPAETAFGHDQTCVTRTFFGGFNHVSILTDSKESRIYLDEKKNRQISVEKDVYEVAINRI